MYYFRVTLDTELKYKTKKYLHFYLKYRYIPVRTGIYRYDLWQIPFRYRYRNKVKKHTVTVTDIHYSFR